MTFCKECGEDFGDDAWECWKHLTDPDGLCSLFIYDHMTDEKASDARFARIHAVVSKFKGKKP